MTVDLVVELANKALYTVILTSAPVLIVSLVIGLIVSIFQTVTSIQEQTLTFVPKIVAVFVTLMLNQMTNLMVDMWSDFSVYIR